MTTSYEPDWSVEVIDIPPDAVLLPFAVRVARANHPQRPTRWWLQQIKRLRRGARRRLSPRGRA